MTEHCTCGTLLVQDASFCHRCGRPVREVRAEEMPPPLPFSAVKALTPVPVGFRNPLALRVAFLMSLGIMLLQVIPGLNLLFAVWWLGAGWGAVAIYRRITGTAGTVGAGARLGSHTRILYVARLTRRLRGAI